MVKPMHVYGAFGRSGNGKTSARTFAAPSANPAWLIDLLAQTVAPKERWRSRPNSSPKTGRSSDLRTLDFRRTMDRVSPRGSVFQTHCLGASGSPGRTGVAASSGSRHAYARS